MSDKTLQEMMDEAVDKAFARNIEELRSVLTERKFLSISDISYLTGYSRKTIEMWIRRDEDPLPAFQIGREYRVKYHEFDLWFERQSTIRHERKEKLAIYEAIKK